MATDTSETRTDVLMANIDARYRQVISSRVENFDGSQNRHEFRAALRYLEGMVDAIPSDSIWFLEIGAFKGLWALAFFELCRAAGKTPHYVTVTWVQHDPANQDIFKTKAFYDDQGVDFHLVDMNSTTEAARNEVTQIRSEFHLVLIDGDHTFPSVMADIANYGPLATQALLFHDIYTKDCGVRKAIEKSGIPLNIKISYGDIMGIGIHTPGIAFQGNAYPKKRFSFFGFGK